MINFLSPLFLGLVVIELKRSSIQVLERKHPEVNIGIFQFTALKLFFSTLAVLPFIFFLEVVPFSAGKNWIGELPLTMSYCLENLVFLVAVSAGGIITMFFQLNFTFLTMLASAMTIGITTGAKIIPQWLGSIVIYQAYDRDKKHIFGALLILLSSLLWLKVKYKGVTNETIVFELLKEEDRKSKYKYDTF